MMSLNNNDRSMTLDSEPPRPEGVSDATGEERSEDIMFGTNDASTSKPNGSVGVDFAGDHEVKRNL